VVFPVRKTVGEVNKGKNKELPLWEF
jgi:hypothetical protein